MARLEFINFKPWRESIYSDGSVAWKIDPTSRPIERLPQIFWNNGGGWNEANHWALEKATQVGIKIETVHSLMKHLHAYACWLEENGQDWRHFPIRKADRATVRFRGSVVKKMEKGVLSSSTARSRMRALIQFYRHCDAHGFVQPEYAIWLEKTVVIPYFDASGFKRAILQITTDLAIRNRSRPGVRLEDGLVPLRCEHMEELLHFTSQAQTQDLHFMLTLGFFTGARIGTISALRVEDLENAIPDPTMEGFFLLPVGPNAGIQTKSDVNGDLLMPDFLLRELKAYAYSPQRLKREALAKKVDRSILFLTKRGNRYALSSVSRKMTDLRRNSVKARLKFMKRFKFHQSRATYGTWLMTVALTVTTPAAAIEFVKNAMLHKDDATTWRYIHFLENSKAKQKMANAFTEAFTGIRNRNWNEYHA
ncbi:MAG: site-specific integrase [Azonexus sp.]|uniref:tyrosine-type recombinase/integrase n=1 Tax=Azonexus sp. TaxID=1872668 RepID=UPI0028256BD0|nr:site-specific integrase [Azonexus sp.]MDR0776492.1 site-specific integrase [Azonexus sp.]